MVAGEKHYSTDTEAECSEEEPAKKFKAAAGKETSNRRKVIDESSILTGNIYVFTSKIYII